MGVDIIMPKNGMDMTEGKIIRWLKNEGDRVEKDEPIMEIETDKITMELEAPCSGVLTKKLCLDGESVPVLTVIGCMSEEGEACMGDEYEYDIAVIGGGPAGYVGAIKAAQLGGRVILFEKDTVGGTCLNRGCIPTKTYLKTAEYLHHIRRAKERGIVLTGEAAVDMEKVVKYKERVVRTLTTGVAGLLKANGIAVVKGEASLTSAHEIRCGGTAYTAKNILLCGGSSAGVIPIPGVEHPAVVTSDGILDKRELPERLVIIGGGVIGCEIGCAFSSFGSKVTIIEMMDRLVANMDEAVSAEIFKSLKANGADILLGAKVEGIEDNGGKPVVVTSDARVECDCVLISIGRKADLSSLGDMKDAIKTERGKVTVDDRMETSVPGIFAPGDINGRLMLAHSAFKMAECAAENAMGGDKKCDLSCTPSCLYTLPEAAGAGLTEAAARERYGEDITVGSFPMMANGRSLASGEKAGFVKVIADKKYGRLIGVHIVGADAAEMIAEPAALMSMEVTVNEIADDIIHAHPTYGEAFMEACADALGRCIHLPPKTN